MHTKRLTTKKKVEKIGESGLNPPIELDYYLIDSKEYYSPELWGKRVYGIAISKKIDDNCFEEKAIKNFSCCKDSTLEVIYRLANNAVTPISLEHILDDFLGT
jgi:hypothetical protein